jgi:hypothetical protein
LEVREATVQLILMYLSNGLQERERHVLADNGGALQYVLLLGRQPIHAGRQDRLHRRGHLQARQSLRQAVGPPRPD